MSTEGTTSPSRYRPETIPVAPIARVVNERIAILERDPAIRAAGMGGIGAKDQLEILSAYERVALAVWPDLDKPSAVRMLWRIRECYYATIDFDVADRILCALGLPWLWLADDELREVYMAANLRFLDVIRPTCEATQEQFLAEARAAITPETTNRQLTAIAKERGWPIKALWRVANSMREELAVA